MARVIMPGTSRSLDAIAASTAARSRLAVAAAAVGAGGVAIVWRFLTFSGFNNDHYVHLARAQQMLLGEWPVRDFTDPGMPLMYAVHAAARGVFGSALGVEWALVATAFGIGAACTLIAATRLSGSLGIALVATALEILIYPRSFGYPKILLYSVAALVIISMARRVTVGTLAAGAAMTVVAFLFRHDHGLFIGLACLTAAIVASRAEGARITLRRGATFAALVVLLLLPWLLFVQAYQGLGSYVASAISFSEGEAVGNALREVPRLRLDDLTSGRNALGWLFYLFHALPAAAILMLVRRTVPDAWPGETTVVAAMAVMALPVNVTFLRGNLDGRVPDAIVPAALLASWLLGRAVRARGSRVVMMTAAGVLVAVSAWAIARIGDVQENFTKTEVLRGPGIAQQRAADLWDRFRRPVPERDHVPSRYAQALLPFIDYVGRCTARQDRLLVTWLFPEINVMADRGFAGGHVSFQPFLYTSEIEQTRTIDRLKKQSVPFVVSARRWHPELKAQMGTLFAYLEQRFEPMVHVPVPETDGVDVLIERGRNASRVDAATGWPCFQ
jgi:hypothetical protein